MDHVLRLFDVSHSSLKSIDSSANSKSHIQIGQNEQPDRLVNDPSSRSSLNRSTGGHFEEAEGSGQRPSRPVDARKAASFLWFRRILAAGSRRKRKTRPVGREVAVAANVRHCVTRMPVT